MTPPCAADAGAGDPSLDVALHRRRFPALQDGIYANFGARGVMPAAAIEAVADTLTTMQSVGPASRIGSALVTRETVALRKALAGLVNVDQGRVALTGNVSLACALAVLGIVWRPGDHAILGEGEPPGSWLMAREVAEREEIALSALERRAEGNPSRRLERLAELLCPRTRLILLSHVDWVTGDTMALAELVSLVRGGPCPDAVIAIDGAQAVGRMPVDLRGLDIDLYAIAGQKWLGGPDGLAAAILPDAPRRLRPSVIGWRAIATGDGQDGDTLRLADGATRFESGTAAEALLPGLRVAIGVAEAFAPIAWRHARIAQLTQRLTGHLDTLSDAHPRFGRIPGGAPGIVSFSIADQDCEGVLRRLERRGIVARTHHFPACVRLCLHYLTLEHEVDAMAEAISEILAKPGGS